MKNQDLRIILRVAPETLETFDWLQERIPLALNHSDVLRRCAKSFEALLENQDRPVIQEALQRERDLGPVRTAPLRTNFRVNRDTRDSINLAEEFFGARSEKDAIARTVRLFRSMMSDESLKLGPDAPPHMIRISENEIGWLFF